MKRAVIDILEELEATAGNNLKKDILTGHKDNELLLRTFVAAFDPYVVYYVNKFKMPMPVSVFALEPTNDTILSTFLDVIKNQLSTRKITGNEAKDTVNHMFSLMTPLEQKWCLRILLKNMRCGVQESTINKIWPGSLKSFAVSLAETLKSEFIKGEGIKILDRVKYPVRIEPKLDGLRCIAVKQNWNVTLYTRNGTMLETLPRIKATLEQAEVNNFVLDGEAIGKNWNESNSVLMSKKSKHDDSNIIYNVFDAMLLKDWIAQECSMPYAERVKWATTIVEHCDQSVVQQVPHITAENEKELLMFFQKCMDEGFEGVMLKTVDTPYKFKRSKNILKLKPCATYEGVIVSHYEGRRGTKREGLFGGFEVVLQNGVITRVGNGFSDSLKAEIQLVGPSTYIRKIVEIEAQPDPMTVDGLTSDGKARFPVFCRVRDESDVDPWIIETGRNWFLKNEK